MDGKTFKGLIAGIAIGFIILGSILTGAVLDRRGNVAILDKLLPASGQGSTSASGTVRVTNEESVVTSVVEKATPSVVTVSIVKPATTNLFGNGTGFDFFGNFFGMPQRQQQPTPAEPQDIGSGFIISADGLIVTNKHVVADTTAKYKVIIGKDDVEDVVNIYRDPLNDLAILKVNKIGLTPVNLGDSDNLKVGQSVIAIGTALGEFRSTVTTGVISGLGRGITAGSPFEGSERLDNVIQTDAAINPGNSGGPLFDSSGDVIGVNVAVSQSGQNIGFALPINIVKDSISNFKTTGEFDRPFLGVAYKIISKQSALLNEVPQGAYVQEVIAGSPAEKAGIKMGDIITEIDGKKLSDNESEPLATYINKKKIGDSIGLTVYRDGKSVSISAKLEKKTG